MRVLQIAPSIARKDGGPSEVLRGTIPALRERGIDVELVTTDKGLSDSDMDLASDPSVRVFKSRPPASWTFAPSLAFGLAKLVSQFDLVHVHSINTFTSTVGMRAARRAHVPYLLQPHGALDDYHMAQGAAKKALYNKWVDGPNFAHVSGFIASSPRELTQGMPYFPSSPSFLVPLGVSPELFDLASTGTNSDRALLFLGRVTEKKRLDLVLRALALLGDVQVRLVVAGPIDPQLPYDPRKLAIALGVDSMVSFVGPVDGTERARLLETSSAFILPSEDESFGVAVAEAMAAGVAVIASENVGIAPAAAGEAALVLCATSPESIAHEVRRLVDTPGLIETTGDVARRYAASNFTWSLSADALASAYESTFVSSPRVRS